MADSEQKKIKDTEPGKELDPHKAEWVNIGEDELKLRINFLAEKLAQTLGFPQEDLLPLIRVPSYKLNIRGPQANLRTRAVANAINDKLKLNIAEQKINLISGTAVVSMPSEDGYLGEVMLYHLGKSEKENEVADFSATDYLKILNPTISHLKNQHELYGIFPIPNYPIQT